VTDLAIPREACRLMIRIICVVVVVPMTRIAVGRRPLEARTVTVVAVEASMGAGQLEELIMIGDRAFPGLRTVTLFAVRREPGSGVIWRVSMPT